MASLTLLTKEMALLACFLCFSFVLNVVGAYVTVQGSVSIHGSKPISKTDESYVCATLDWWPPEYCNQGVCSWGNASILNLDLNNSILFNAVKAFSSLRLRLGGTLQDRVILQTEDRRVPCVPFVLNSSQLYGFTEGCFPLARWDELHNFFNKTGAVITFGLNDLFGKVIVRNTTASGDWVPTNAASFLRYTVQKGYKVYGWELGNELGGRLLFLGVSAGQYASDTNTLHSLIEEIYPQNSTKSRILAPGGLFERKWFKEYISLAKPRTVITHHIYNLMSGTAEQLIPRILDPSYLDNITSVFDDLQKIIKNSRTSVSAWVSEAGGIFNSGRNRVSNAFVNSFWYLDQLGIAASYGTKVYCRQSLIGGNYGLLNVTTFIPNPDYYSALLWKRLMGREVLSTKFTGPKKIRAYAHCAVKSEGLTLLLINLDGDTTVKAYMKFKETGTVREEYHLTPMGGNIQSSTVLLNGKALSVDSSGAIPVLEPVTVNSTGPVTIGPLSIVFVHLPDAAIPACK